MDTDLTDRDAILLALTTEIVVARLGNNKVRISEVPALITSVHSALSELGSPQNVQIPRPEPAVAIDKSVTDESIACLACGREMKNLRRHIASYHGMTPDQYRQRWKLAEDYPMVSPQYSERRRELAVECGLGRSHRRKGSC